ncbi:ligand-gated channel [Rhodanobacter thiooxydans]|uniref:Ligand-gated channel n=1 Tax=Rhodanobacter thiooxydans TaxID=416169 RepID=A0A154QLI7_9GAMM|nr:TonB-dependent receptor [Rhodanobacter thiooxydans]EIM01487.1 outer membrane receptor protein [Rhodanobacter thiooxydans LCS2]KZC25030.1 ligand-gated channel [Rhodanobacter thiooxydans]MCW0202273.1 TonB-dependent receptor [Rhodanobacter thiooxydans]
MDIPPFDLPAALSMVQIEPAASGQPGVNLSESLVGVPGILARDRQNYAQDAQISIRGFGSRATFGVRSIRLYVDGIPATLPDGQGQVSHFNFDSAERVEILRGPFSVLYGNAAGGVVQLWSAEGTPVPVTTLGVNAGSNDTFRYSVDTRGTVGRVDYNVAGSLFLSGGYRRHSRVRRESDNARFGVDLGDGKKLTIVANRLNQPVSQDPLGLTRAQVDADPRQVAAVANQYNTRKSILQNQLGAVYEQQLDSDDQLRVMGYGGQRRIRQYQSIPVSAQRNPLSAGGVVALDTDYGGLDARWTRSGQLAGRDYEFVLGASADGQWQHRRGYENFVGGTLGVTGALRRNEDDNVHSVDEYAQWYWHFAKSWSLLLGVRHDDVRFRARDHYVTATNPNDSGSKNYTATTPVLGLGFRPSDNLRLYASYGKGFETPSFNELGYRSDGRPGMAFDLRPARSRNLELGAKWQVTRGLAFDTALFRADTRDELAVGTNRNGRSTYRNVGDTRRQGVELSLDGQLADHWRISAGFTHLQARFRSAFLACRATPCSAATVPVARGTRMPGVPENYGSLRIRHGGELGWQEGLDVTGVGAVTVNDTATQQAAGYALVGVDVGYTFALAASTRLQLSARVDNLGDRRYIGSVIVNDSNGRYFEPGPGRTWMLGARLVF